MKIYPKISNEKKELLKQVRIYFYESNLLNAVNLLLREVK